MLNTTRSILRRTGLLAAARRIKDLIYADRREVARAQHREVAALRQSLGPDYTARILAAPAPRRVLANGLDRASGVILQAPLLLAFRLAGYEPVILLDSRSSGWLESTYRVFGIRRFAYFEDHLKASPQGDAQAMLDQAGSDLNALIGLGYRDTALGRYAASTLMRRTRNGSLDLGAPETRASATAIITEAMRYTDALIHIINAHDISGALILDRGYSPQGQVFDLVMKRTGMCITWNSGHRNGILMLKRYNPANVSDHPSTLSAKSWQHMRAVSWNQSHWERVSQEIQGGYRSGEWFSAVGNQVNKSFPNREALISRLGLDPKRKTAILFAHIFWDSTFFWGTDLFGNFENWFKVALQAACANTEMNWLIKVHPANMAKDARDGYVGEHSEIRAIRETIGQLPPHVKLLPADTDISTLALFEIMDYCLTVRGTIGIEASCAGIPVITAGTGRYDRLGFTVDPETPGQYLDTLANLASLPPMSPEQVELARRFAYGIFVARPVAVSSINFRFGKDAAATLAVSVDASAASDPLGAADIQSLARWIQSGDEDFLNHV